MVKEIITTLITSLVSVIGFIVTYRSLMKSFKNELRKSRDSLALEKMSTVPYDILELFDDLMESSHFKKDSQKAKENQKTFKKLMNTIYSYGSINAIKIFALMQKENYDRFNQGGNLDDIYRISSMYVLLATQIKYDVTGIIVSPNSWFEMRITDYSSNMEKYKRANNKIVDELRLNSGLKI